MHIPRKLFSMQGTKESSENLGPETGSDAGAQDISGDVSGPAG